MEMNIFIQRASTIYTPSQAESQERANELEGNKTVGNDVLMRIAAHPSIS
jgi:hypothetical protein